MEAGSIHQAYSGEGRCEKTDQRLGLKIGSQDTLGLLLKNPSLEMSLWDRSHLHLLLKGCCLLAAQHWCIEQSVRAVPQWNTFLGVSQVTWVKTVKSGSLAPSFAGCTPISGCRPILQKWPATSSRTKKGHSHPHIASAPTLESSSTCRWAAEVQCCTELWSTSSGSSCLWSLLSECQEV